MSEKPLNEIPGEMIEIPDNALIRCPLVSFNLARVATCASCPGFRGLADRFPGSEAPFAKRYLVQCVAEPVKRELMELTAVRPEPVEGVAI